MPKRLNLVGQKFGRLLVIEFTYVRNGCSYWRCLCDCGEYSIVRGNNLKDNHTESCGCYHRQRAAEVCRLDLIGRKFGRLVVLENVGKDKCGSSQFFCGCDCGNKVVVRGSSLKSGHSKSCGCFRKDKTTELNYKHGMCKTRSYKNRIEAERRARKLNQTAADVNLEKMEMIYGVCADLNRLMGYQVYDVDHIIPLSKGGLHHQDNLQILLKCLNRKKGNKITDEYKGIVLKDLNARK